MDKRTCVIDGCEKPTRSSGADWCAMHYHRWYRHGDVHRVSVEWVGKCEPRELQPDHLNGDGSDNRIDNLVPACRTCNTARGGQARSDALREAGFWSGNDTVAHLKSGGRRSRIEPAA